MDAKEMMHILSTHSVVRSDMTMQVQLGLPYLDKRMDKLCVSCLPHREEYRDECVVFYQPQYRITWVYPFQKIIAFENSAYFRPLNCSEPVCSVKSEQYILRGRSVLNELYAQCSGLLAAYEREGTVSDVALRRYRREYYEAVRELGLTDIYGENRL